MSSIQHHEGDELFSNHQISVIDCRACGYAHLKSLPSNSDLEKYYQDSFYQKTKKNYFSDFERDSEWWSLNYKWLLLETIGLLKLERISKPKLLDIGSGPGLLMHVANNLGFDSVGVEPSTEAFNYSRKRFSLNVHNTTLDNFIGNPGEFDVIVSYLVLEHILDPLNFLRKAREFLSTDGIMCIVVPNDFNPIQRALSKVGYPSWWVDPKDHLNYFNLTTLENLCKKADLIVVDTTVTFPIDLFLLMGDDYINSPEVGPKCHQRRKHLEFALDNNVELKKGLYNGFKSAGIGRELVFFVRRNESKSR